MACLSLALLGPPQVHLNDVLVTGFESKKVEALLMYLAVESDRPHSREKLAGMLWAEDSERHAHHSLSQALFDLRRVLGDMNHQSPFIIPARDEIRFNLKSDYWLDSIAFTGLLTPCRDHRHARLEICDSCVERLQQAAALFRGDFLEGFTARSSAFDEWCALHRERFHQQILSVLYSLTCGYEGRGEYQKALLFARQQVELDPWREEAYRQIMQLLARDGQRSAALMEFKTCCRLLTQELGVGPSSETVMLYRRIQEEKPV
jgi:DNA-binding SARP family transcriptional activator